MVYQCFPRYRFWKVFLPKDVQARARAHIGLGQGPYMDQARPIYGPGPYGYDFDDIIFPVKLQ